MLSKHRFMPAVLAAGLLLCAPLQAHELEQWLLYPGAGSVRIRTKSTVLLNGVSPAQVLDFQATALDTKSGVFSFGLTPSVPTLGGVVMLHAPKGAKASLLPASGSLADWEAMIADLVGQSVERKGDPVANVTLDQLKWRGMASFKTKPTPFGPIHKVTVTIDVSWRATVMLQAGGTKTGKVTAAIASKGAVMRF
jgi:hypothetical protein